MIELKGITWDHARGYDPMIATAEAYMGAHPDVKITWQKRSLKEFGDYPIEKLAEIFDLLVIDHPFVGFAAASGCLIPLDEYIDDDYLADQQANSVGKSHLSYFYGGHQWALAIDAAAQISTYRADLLEKVGAEIPHTWDEVLALAHKLKAGGQYWVGVPFVAIDAFMCLFSIAASLGEEPCAAPDYFLTRSMGREALGIVIELSKVCHPKSMKWNPIQMFNFISRSDEVVYCPLTFGYSNYGRVGFSDKLMSFTNIPAPSGTPRGAILGGTGYAIASHCQHVAVAVDYGKFTASGEVQRGLYFQGGGQPGHRSAWLDEEVNAASNNFFRDTLETLDNAYLRPRYNGYVPFQETAWYTVHDFLVQGGEPDDLLDTLDDLYRKSSPL
jgi:multiple sugar transport system substrate-binding protein